MLKHSKLIISRLLKKYDNICVVTLPPGTFAGPEIQGSSPGPQKLSQKDRVFSGNLAQKDEFIADNIGSLMRIYTKSKLLSQVFEDFDVLEKIV